MLFYQIEATADNIVKILPQEGTRDSLETVRTKVEQCRKEETLGALWGFLFLKSYQPDTIFLGAAMSDPLCREHLAFLEYLGFTGVQIREVEEITGSRLQEMLECAERSMLIKNHEAWLASMQCLRFYRDRSYNRNRCTELEEALLPQVISSEKIIQQTQDLLCADTMLPEFDRIQQPPLPEHPKGHPVHYFIQMSTQDRAEQAARLLLETLYQNGRLESRRYCTCALWDLMEYSDFDAVYDNAGHGALIVFCKDLCPDGAFAHGDDFSLSVLARRFCHFSGNVLLLLCLPPEAERTKQKLQAELTGISLVEIREDPAPYEEAVAYLCRRAERDNIPADPSLWKGLTENVRYWRQELDECFRNWRREIMRTLYYPQYAYLSSAPKQEICSPVQGSAYDRLQQMVGLKQVKAIVDEILDYTRVQKLCADPDAAQTHPSFHMVFTGNPGSAKTTVARLIAEILAENQVLYRGKLHEVGRSDLVGKYVGWTAKLVKEAFEKAKGSVLFIDEAYSLVDKQGGFGDEAINAIVQEMENSRGSTVVIFAGYPDKMEHFLDRNPGLRSRIAFYVPFDDYTPEELVEITGLLAAQKRLSLAPGTEEKLLSIYRQAVGTPDFGNGRLARNLLERACIRQASRLVRTCPEEIRQWVRILQPEDFADPLYIRKPERRVIGFVS